MTQPAPLPAGDPIAHLSRLLSRLPGIGERTAQRLTFHILRGPASYAHELSRALERVVNEIRLCSRCCTLTPTDPCVLCSDARRDGHLVCVVEAVQDVAAIERTREFRGRYHVLHGALSPLDGIGPEQLKVRELLARVSSEGLTEVVLATNPTVEGDATALYLSRLLQPLGVSVTRIAQGIPMGGGLEYIDQITLARALSGRRSVADDHALPTPHHQTAGSPKGRDL